MIRSLVMMPLALALTGCALLPEALAADPLAALQERIISVGQKLTPSVVNIEAAVRQNNRRNIVTGSGFLMDETGVVITNEHVVERAEKVTVIVPGRVGNYPAEIVGTDKLTDLAVLRIRAPEGEPPFRPAIFGDSDKLRVGEWVIAIGNPYGLDGTVSLGIVSAKGRDLGADNLLNDFIQTDAMIDRGSSGGPLVNLEGEVVGVNSRGQGRGIGFTIPINTAERVARDLLGTGIARGYLGIAIQPLSRKLARYWGLEQVNGVVVNGVTFGSPAAEAGLEVGDILSEFDGEPVGAEKDEDIGQFQRLVAQTEVGKEVPVRIHRKGSAKSLTVKVGRQPKVVPDEEETEFGFTVQEVTQTLYRQYRLASRDGVLVSFVERGSEAAEADMNAGDLVRRVEGEEIADIEGFRRAIAKIAPDSPFLVEAERGEDTRFLLIVPREGERRALSGEPSPDDGREGS